jgi:Dolichyl-phosphate-mannose-protein mannosyltransferase
MAQTMEELQRLAPLLDPQPLGLPPEAPAPRRERETPWEPAPPAPSRLRKAAHLLAGAPGVALAAVVVGILAAWFASSHDLMFLYADARSHLTIARRLVDGSNAGLVQLGTVWLPLPHVLLVPFVGSKWLWHTGLAAIPLDIGCLVIEALSVFAIVKNLGRSRAAAWVGVAILLVNPSILYLHTTALTEPVLFAAMLGTTATLVKWAQREKPYSGGEMAVFCGIPAACAVLARYDGWAFVAAATALVFAIAWMRWRTWRYALRIARCFATIPAVAALWWFWFNWVNWGDPLEFQRGRYSAQAQQALLAKSGNLPDQGDPLRSLDTFSASMVRGVGWLVLGLAIVGMVIWLFRRAGGPARFVPWLLVVVPFGFYVLSLFTGQIALRLETTPTESMFNLRYGVEMLPGLAVFAGLGVAVMAGALRRSPARWIVVAAGLVLVVAQAVSWWPGWRQVPVVEEGLAQRKAGAGQYAAGEWLGEHATSGKILIDDSVNPLLPVVDADLNRVIAPFTGRSWRKALRDPARAEWVYVDIANPQDSVARAMRNDPDFHRQFVRRFSAPGAEVYQRRATS